MKLSIRFGPHVKKVAVAYAQLEPASSVSGSPVHAVLLAAGRGKRLAPHTDRVPKPLLSLNGRPLLEYALHHLKQAGVRRSLSW